MSFRPGTGPASTTEQTSVNWRIFSQQYHSKVQNILIIKLPLARRLRTHYTVFARFPTLFPLAHLGVEIVLNHMLRFACLFIKDLTPFLRSIRRSIH